MTNPMSDPSGSVAPGYYHAEGDPPGLVRYWDGTQWTGDPIPPPPAGTPTPTSHQPTADLGIRIGAILLDGLFYFITVVAFFLPFADFETNDDNGFDFQASQTGAEAFIGPLVYVAITVVLVATKGGSPGKLITGLRVTTADGTTPPGFGPAALRMLPWLVTLIPFLGFFIWIGLAISGMIMISNDPQNRSPFDRIGNTLVVRK